MAKVRLGKALKDLKMSKRLFAKKLGIEYPNVFRLFKPEYDPKLSTITEWAKVLRVRVSELIED